VSLKKAGLARYAVDCAINGAEYHFDVLAMLSSSLIALDRVDGLLMLMKADNSLCPSGMSSTSKPSSIAGRPFPQASSPKK